MDVVKFTQQCALLGHLIAFREAFFELRARLILLDPPDGPGRDFLNRLPEIEKQFCQDIEALQAQILPLVKG